MVVHPSQQSPNAYPIATKFTVTTGRTVLPDKRTGFQFVKKFLDFMEHESPLPRPPVTA